MTLEEAEKAGYKPGVPPLPGWEDDLDPEWAYVPTDTRGPLVAALERKKREWAGSFWRALDGWLTRMGW